MRHDFSRIDRKKAVAVGGVCVALLCVILYSFYRSTAAPTVEKKAVKPEVVVYEVERRDMLRRISLFGQTVSEAHIALAPKYSGRITAVNVNLGDVVREGEVLLVQDTGDLDLSIRENQAVVRQAEADAMESESIYAATYHKVNSNYTLKKQNYERYRALYEQGAISKEALDTVYQEMVDSQSALDTLLNQAMTGEVPASVESKRAALSKAERATNSLEKQRGDLLLKAPRGGVIGFRDAEVGEIAQAGQKVLELVDNSRMYIDCQLSEQDVAAVQVGTPVTAKVESLGRAYAGQIIYVSPANSVDSKSYSVRIALDAVDERIRGGMFARTQIEVLQRPSTLCVPKDSIVEKNGKTSVFVIDAAGRAEERSVTLGLRNDAEAEVLSGLEAGERVATTNLARLKTGVAIGLVDAEAAS